MSSYRSSRSDQLGEAALGGLIGLVVVLLIVGVSLVVKALIRTVRTFAAHPENPALWISLGICLGLWCLAGIAGVLAPESSIMSAFVALALLATGAVLLTARIVELYYDDLFQRERAKDTLVRDVLSRRWWDAA